MVLKLCIIFLPMLSVLSYFFFSIIQIMISILPTSSLDIIRRYDAAFAIVRATIFFALNHNSSEMWFVSVTKKKKGNSVYISILVGSVFGNIFSRRRFTPENRNLKRLF